MQKGYLVLNGGQAFVPESKETDRAWLKLLRGRHNPRVVVVPVAAMEKHQRVADEVTRYFSRLNTYAQHVSITNWHTANTETEYTVLDKVEAIVFTDGSPVDMIERLRGTHTEAALHRALMRKAAVMGTGASAMALGGVLWFAHDWMPGLALAPHLAFLAHHNLFRMRLSPERLLAGLPEGVTLIGIDQTATLICHPDDTYQVVGQGGVCVYRSAAQLDEYPAGSTFALG